MTHIDLWFRVRGETLPSLHGYTLYAAISNVAAHLHEAPWLGIHTIRGQRIGDRQILLARDTRLGLRLPVEKMAEVLCLTGKTLDVAGHPLVVGTPEIQQLRPSPVVSARMVTIAGFEQSPPEEFLAAAERQLVAMDIAGRLELGPRLVQSVVGQIVVGYGMRVHDLSDDHAVQLQAQGIGGRRRMGCGLFRAPREST